jgi:NADPH:quinone reductase-like Zn-dependent oxidoreductase
MKCLRLHEWGGRLIVEDVPDPVLREDELLMRVQACS